MREYKKRNLGGSAMELESDDVVILVSYTTPVAAWVTGVGCVVTDTNFSHTTSKQITKWLGGSFATSAVRGQCKHRQEVPQQLLWDLYRATDFARSNPGSPDAITRLKALKKNGQLHGIGDVAFDRSAVRTQTKHGGVWTSTDPFEVLTYHNEPLAIAVPDEGDKMIFVVSDAPKTQEEFAAIKYFTSGRKHTVVGARYFSGLVQRRQRTPERIRDLRRTGGTDGNAWRYNMPTKPVFDGVAAGSNVFWKGAAVGAIAAFIYRR